MLVYIGLSILIIIMIVLWIWKKQPKKVNKKNKQKKNKKQLIKRVETPLKKDYDKYNIIGNTYLKCKIGDEDHYLTWRYAGRNIRNNHTYNLVLLPYKNKQNEFKTHVKDHIYLKAIYEKYGLYNVSMKDKLNEHLFVTSDYNQNLDQYLELEKIRDQNNDNIYLVRASIWLEKGPYAYLHLDDKNKLYFDNGSSQDNIAKFSIE